MFLGAGQMVVVHGCFHGQVHLDVVEAFKGRQWHASRKESVDGRRGVNEAIVSRCGLELVIF